jgi:predicted NBD/HSP70 family sugar kinase
LAKLDLHQAAKLVRGLADKGDPLCKEVFRVQAHALGLFFDEMVNTLDPDAFIVGGGAQWALPPSGRRLRLRRDSRTHVRSVRQVNEKSTIFVGESQTLPARETP